MASCFFCLQDSQNNFKSELDFDISKKAEPVFVDNLFPLRHISRFLNLFEDNDNDHNGSGKRKISKQFKNKLFKFANDSMVSVCEDCSKLMKEFTELYHLMEVTKLRLNWCVQRMNNVMTKTKDQSTFLESENGENLLEAVRTKTMDRMRVMASLPPVPRVVLHKIRKRPRLVGNRADEWRSMTTSTQIVRRGVDVGASITNLVKLLVSKPVPDQDQAEASPPTKLRSPGPGSVADFVKCPHCRAQFKAIGINSQPGHRKWFLRQHNLQYHCDVFFPHHKLDSISDTQFKKILSDLLFKDLIVREECPYCQEKFSVGTNNRLYKISKIKSHLVDFHFPQLEELLLNIQKDPNLPRILEECNPMGTFCECGVYISNKDGWARHEKFHCVLTTTTKMKALGLVKRKSFKTRIDHGGKNLETSTVGCSYCRASFLSTLNQRSTYGAELLRRHMLQYHLLHYFPNHRLKDTVTDSQFQKILSELLFSDLIEGRSSCVYCEKQFTIPSKSSDRGMQNSRVKLHYIENHYEDMEKKLRMIQEDPDLSAKLNVCNRAGGMCPLECGVYIPKLHHNMLATHLKLHCTKAGTRTGSEVDDLDLPSNLLLSSTSREENEKGKAKLPKTYKPFRVRPGSGFPTSCPYCRYRCPPDQASASMRRHLLRFHPQYYFPQVLCVTQDQFQRVLQDILFPELTTAVSVDGAYSCQFCGDHFKGRYNSTSQIILRRHLVSIHKKQMTDRLDQILADPELEGKLVKANPDGVFCPCGMYITSNSDQNILYHQKLQCNLQSPEEEAIDIDGSQEFSDEEEIPSHFLLASPTSIKKKKKKIDCSESECTSASVELISCRYCRYKCRWEQCSASMKRHHLRFHPEHYFPDLKDQYQVLGITSDQFQRVLHDILFPELNMNLATGNKELSCTFCDSQFKSKDKYTNDTGFRRHLVDCHKTEVTNRLEDILKDPDLERRIVKANPEGVSCPCGVYLPSGSGDGFQQGYHDKFQCNLKAKENAETTLGIRSQGMEVDYEEDGGQYQDDDLENEEGDFSGEEEEQKFNCETIEMTIDRAVDEVFVDESDPLEF